MANSPISIDPEIMSGTPCFSGTRVPIKNLFDCLQDNYSVEEFLLDFPTVEAEQVVAVLQLAFEKVIEVPS